MPRRTPGILRRMRGGAETSPDPVFAWQGSGHVQCAAAAAYSDGYALTWAQLASDGSTKVWFALLDGAGALRTQPRPISADAPVSRCPTIILADDDIGVFWSQSPYKIAHAAFELDGTQRVAPHEEQIGSGASALQIAWDGNSYGVLQGGSDGAPAFRRFDRDFKQIASFKLISPTTSLWNRQLCAADGRFVAACNKDELIELFVLDAQGTIVESSQIRDDGDVRELVRGGPRVLLVSETYDGLWHRQRLYQLDAESATVLDGPLTLVELAAESVAASGVTTGDGWLLSFETRSAAGETEVNSARLAARDGFGIADGGIDPDASLMRSDGWPPSVLELRSWGKGRRPNLAIAPSIRPLLTYIDGQVSPTRLVTHFVR
jgi:hypothetical protein